MRAAWIVCLLAACTGPAGDLIDDEVVVSEDDKSDADSELRVRTGETTVWMTRELARRESAEGPLYLLRGRASRNLTDGLGFVFDDPYGDFTQRSARTFQVTWPVSVARSLLDGVNQFVRLSFVPSNGRPDSLTARAVVRPRFTTFTGSSSIFLTAEVTPVVVAGEVVYRAKGRTTSPIVVMEVSVNGAAHAFRKVDGTHFEIDLAPDVALAIAGVNHPDANVSVAAELESGHLGTKQAKLGIAIKRLALTAADPYKRFPRPDCDTETHSCLTALPDGALDLASCGEAFVVQSCAGKIGLFADDVSVQAAIAQGNQIAAGTAFRADAKGLVGAERVEQLVGGAEQTIDDRATRLFGRWYLSATARDGRLKAAVDGALLDVYARPLDTVEPLAFVPGDAQSLRHAAADALLGELVRFDFPASEFGRPYDVLVAQFRDRHVSSIRELRETSEIVTHPSFPDRDVVIGRWLDPLVEVSIVRATGAIANVLIEID